MRSQPNVQMRNRKLIPYLLILTPFLVLFQSCRKTDPGPGSSEEPATEQSLRKRNPTPPPPPPPPPFALNCASGVRTGSFVVGVPTTATITLSYANSPGGSYPAFTSASVNGISFTAPAGVFNTGSGTIKFTASGTPAAPGYFYLNLSIGGSNTCLQQLSVVNAPVAGGNCSDPTSAVGSTGCITFIYKGQQVTYSTVRAADGKIWLRQNLGSPQVAFHSEDVDSYGDYFQWGRWDDGHQQYTSPAITGGSALQNPSHIAGGNPSFIKGTTIGTKWWSVGSSSTDTWSGTNVTATNGKDPCAALGAGWHLPSQSEWTALIAAEFITEGISAFESNLKLPMAGKRLSYDGMRFPSYEGNYWSSTAAGTNMAYRLKFDDGSYNNAGVKPTERGQGYSCRCVKN